MPLNKLENLLRISEKLSEVWASWGQRALTSRYGSPLRPPHLPKAQQSRVNPDVCRFRSWQLGTNFFVAGTNHFTWMHPRRAICYLKTFAVCLKEDWTKSSQLEAGVKLSLSSCKPSSKEKLTGEEYLRMGRRSLHGIHKSEGHMEDDRQPRCWSRSSLQKQITW